MEEVDLYLHYDAQGNITVSVVYPEGNTNTLYVPYDVPPIDRDNRINAFRAEQQALLDAS
ncbi:hypothetical protein [Agrobacterium cavarae]|uniref:hypothetical protein n=1 Tax=Agrobacterium cavarae TaxID=2528239 RepID=UPI003CFE7D6A